MRVHEIVREGWIYILINPALQKDLLKVGKTTLSSEDRAKQLSSTGVPTEFHVAYDIKVADCDKAEALVHSKLANYRYKNNREFFKIPLKLAIPIVDKVAEEIGKIIVENDNIESQMNNSHSIHISHETVTLTIYEKFLSVFENRLGEILSSKEIKDLIVNMYPGTNRTSIIPSDYCYNLVNKGIPFTNHIFEIIGPGQYKVLGVNYNYTGHIFWSKKEEPVGEWRNGEITRDPKENI